MTEHEVRLHGAVGVSLAGSLALPTNDHSGRYYPAMLLISGSGPTDRDGNQLPALRTDLLKQIAALLAHSGIASLRYDKRGVGGSKPLPANQTMEEIAAWENFVGDAVSAFSHLSHQAGVDKTRVGILGHSEGGLIALDGASALRGAPSVLVLASTPGRPIDVVLQEQLASTLKKQNATPEQTRLFLDANSAIVAAIRATGKIPRTFRRDSRPSTRPTWGSSTEPFSRCPPLSEQSNTLARCLSFRGNVTRRCHLGQTPPRWKPHFAVASATTTF